LKGGRDSAWLPGDFRLGRVQLLGGCFVYL